MKRQNQLWDQTKTKFSNIEKSTAIDDWSSTDQPSGFCIPFVNCSLIINEGIALVVLALFILLCYLRYSIYECRQNNRNMNNSTSSNSKRTS